MAVKLPAIGPHITFDAADVELLVAAHKLAPLVIVQDWALFGLRNFHRVQIEAVRIIGTCAICGTRGPISPCAECERDTDAGCLMSRGLETICRECA